MPTLFNLSYHICIHVVTYLKYVRENVPDFIYLPIIYGKVVKVQSKGRRLERLNKRLKQILLLYIMSK